tara:strand:- start:517 stop:732 length:216 start_codon:yes stop_codon:yes gene_type:complete
MKKCQHKQQPFANDPELKKYVPENEEEENKIEKKRKKKTIKEEKKEQMKNKDVMFAIFGDDYLRYLISKKR